LGTLRNEPHGRFLGELGFGKSGLTHRQKHVSIQFFY
jgi:hypothetical protein